MPINHLEPVIPSYRIPVIGRAPASLEWLAAGQLTNRLAGRCRQLIPALIPDQDDLLASSSYQYAARMIRTYQAIDRQWLFAGESVGGYDVTPASAALASLGASDPHFSSPVGGWSSALSEVKEQLAAQSAADETVDLLVEPSADLTVNQFACWETPRIDLTTSALDLGVDTTRLRPTQPIAIAPASNILDAALDLDLGKRVLVHWMVPYELNASTTTQFAASFTSTSFADLWELPIPALVRRLYSGPGEEQVQARIFAWVDNGATVGEVQLTGGSHGQTSTTVTTSSTTPVWLDLITDQDVDVEDMSETDGRVSASWDTLQVRARVQSTGTLYIASAVIWEQLS